MPEYLTNQLHFLTNSKTILSYLGSKKNSDHAPEQFSLNSIRLMPESMNLPLNDQIMCLSIMNLQLPVLDKNTEKVALANLYFDHKVKLPESKISEKIEEIKASYAKPDANKEEIKVFEQAISNFKEFKFFSIYDWRLMNWGTDQDIHSVITSTFDLPTKYIEFETAWTPPISALQILSNTFPSVKFKLKYRLSSEDEWTSVTFFPFPPFSY